MKTFQYLLLSSVLLASPVYALDSDTINKNNGTENTQNSEQKSPSGASNQTEKNEPSAANKAKKQNKHKNIYNKRLSRQPHRENTQH